uniref:Phycocyanin beta subunit n=1 Tax=Bostrychia tenella TaxID=324755 RepID=A0A1Z1M5Q8_9FLOR|nr:phycocyanin beta subunit [Bostrychia tenella]ARW61193.1 phycocyanin beta subunit [Bostrychia tenella]
MLDAFAKVVAQADARGEFLSNKQMEALEIIVGQGNKRLDTVNKINSNCSSIVTKAARSLFSEQPQLIQPGGNAYTSRRMAACLRDMEIILRYVSYAMVAGDSSVLDDRCLNGLRETYQALGTPGASVAVAVQKMKEAAIGLVNDPSGVTSGDCSSLTSELNVYFDRAAAAVV